MLKINRLFGSVSDKQIIKGIDLVVNSGEVHIIMGPNGSGKSSLASLLAGHPSYTIDSGTIEFDGEVINEDTPDERARKGVFLALQQPVEIPGITNSYFIKTALKSIYEHNNLPKLKALDFIQNLKESATKLNFDQQFIKRELNVGFSGGEKKRNEILQMVMLNPKLCILDEIDSGLDVDALADVGKAISEAKSNNSAILIITHYPRLLKYVKADHVHIITQGKVIKSGNEELAHIIEKEGYDTVSN